MVIFAFIPVVIGTLLLIHSRIDSANQANDCQLEYQRAQSALDAYMAYNDQTTVPPATTNDLALALPLHNSSGTPTFVRYSHTTWTYTWDTFGRITAISQSPGGPFVPDGCKPLP